MLNVFSCSRDSIIPLSVAAVDEPEYTNLGYGPDGTIVDTDDPPPPSQPQSTGEACASSDGVTALSPEELKARKAILANLLKNRQYENTELGKGEEPK